MKAWKACGVVALVLGAVCLLWGALANVTWIQMAGDAPSFAQEIARFGRQNPLAPIAVGAALLACGVLLLCRAGKRRREEEEQPQPDFFAQAETRRGSSSAEALARSIEESEISTEAEKSGEAGSIEEILESLQGDPLFNRAQAVPCQEPEPTDAVEEADNPPAPKQDEPAKTYATFHFADVTAPPPEPEEKPAEPVYEENADPEQPDAAVAQKHISGRIVSTVQPRY